VQQLLSVKMCGILEIQDIGSVSEAHTELTGTVQLCSCLPQISP